MDNEKVYTAKNVKKKFIPKKFLRSAKLTWNKKFIQATLYVPDGNAIEYEPKVGLSLKLGNSSLNLLTEDMEAIEQMMLTQLHKFIAGNAATANKTLLKEKEIWRQKRLVSAKKVITQYVDTSTGEIVP